MPSIHLITKHAQHTRQLGEWLGQQLQAGDVICLGGELGAGKTTLAQGLGVGWGAAQTLTSPTYVLVRQYQRAADGDYLHHIDAYRLAGRADAESLALEDMFALPGVVLIEWAENLRDDLPEDVLWLRLAPDADHPDYRHIQAEATGPHSARLLELIGAYDATSD
ncbi:MAG: tRNA (adenosine(37)-N6)-threonylcarbamoyltransferase complex ATPase subunit type 1 TsaE [Anaerolineales bacterium]